MRSKKRQHRKVLLIGSGGREHALLWSLSQSPRIKEMIVAPGNDGFQVPRWDLDLSAGSDVKKEFWRLAKKASDASVDLLVVGPDNPLADGITDIFEAHEIDVFGPSQAASQLEASKGFAKEVMCEAGVPTAKFKKFANVDEAKEFLAGSGFGSGFSGGVVVKADGLALGKGVEVCLSVEDACRAVDRLMTVSGSILLEERLEGEEISVMAFCDGNSAAVLEPARDFKRLKDNDQGPNTGGMGAFSPVLGFESEDFRWRMKREVFDPVLREMKRRRIPFRGFLYAGLMVSGSRVSVLEFNARLGDPEAQVLLPRMEGDLLDWMEASVEGSLSNLPGLVPFRPEHSVVVVGAAPGYPSMPQKGIELEGPLLGGGSEGVPSCFLAGVRADGNGWKTSGGRVFGAVGFAPTHRMAREMAYQNFEKVRLPGVQFRRDIGQKGELA